MSYPTQWQSLHDAIELAWPSNGYRDLGTVVGCSGGADSVALLRVLVQRARDGRAPNRGFIVAAHFDHQLRGEQSDDDAEFVRDLAHDLGVRFEIDRGNGLRRDEETARNERRRFFFDVLQRTGARYLALGHSLDDNVETVLQRLMRGTGPAGLTGIAPFRSLFEGPPGSDFVVARPMLATRRNLIREGLRECGYEWREDSSNQASQYKRNWIRNDLLPMIQEQFPEAIPAIGRAIQGQRQWNDALEPLLDSWISEFRISQDPLIVRRLDQGDNSSQDRFAAPQRFVPQPAVTIEALRRCWLQSGWPLQSMGHSQWTRLVDFLSGRGPDLLSLPGAIDASRDDKWVTIARRV